VRLFLARRAELTEKTLEGRPSNGLTPPSPDVTGGDIGLNAYRDDSGFYGLHEIDEVRHGGCLRAALGDKSPLEAVRLRRCSPRDRL
jgi:hypothetical protein